MKTSRSHLPQNHSADRIVVAMITYLFPPCFAGGTRQAIELAKGLKAKGVDCIFFGANLDGAKAHEVLEGLPVYRLATNKRGRRQYLIYMLMVCWELWNKRHKIDLFFLHSIKPFSCLVIFLAKLLRKPVLVTLTLIGNDDPVSLTKKSHLWRFEARTLKLVDRIICKSQALKTTCLSEGFPEHQLVSIPNGVNISKFKPTENEKDLLALRKRLGLPTEDFIFSFAGRVSFRKGCDILFQFWDEISKKFSNVQLIVLGPNESIQNQHEDSNGFSRKLKEVIANSTSKRIKFLGALDHSKVAEYLRASDCFVFLSRREGLPNAVLEAMASGLPVICSKMPGIADNIIDTGQDGIILENQQVNELIKVVNTMMLNRTKLSDISNLALNKIRNRFAMDIVAGVHAELYRELLNAKRK